MRERRTCGRCRRVFLLTSHKTRCQKCVLSNIAVLHRRFDGIVAHREMREFKAYMDKWYGAAA